MGSEAECEVSIPTAQLTGEKGKAARIWYGSKELAVSIPEDGVWTGMGPERSYFDKLFFLAGGFQPGMEERFTLQARPAGSANDLVEFASPTNARHKDFGGWAILVGVEFPHAGCWELTAQYLDRTLEFVVQVGRGSPPNQSLQLTLDPVAPLAIAKAPTASSASERRR